MPRITDLFVIQYTKVCSNNLVLILIDLIQHPHTLKSVDFQGKYKATPLQVWTVSTRLIRLLLSTVVRNHDPFQIVGVTTFT